MTGGQASDDRVVEAIAAAVRSGGGGIYLGTGRDGWVWSGRGRSTLVLGPTRSGKTSSLVIPNVLGSQGAVVSTSTKSDVMRATAPFRSRVGPAFLYDPSGTVDTPPGVSRIGWSPIAASTTWDGALQTADTMVRAAHGGAPAMTSPVDSHWKERAAALLAPLLHAATLGETSMSTLVSWVDRHHGGDALDILDRHPDLQVPRDLLAGILGTDQREQSGIWSTASGLLGAYRFAAGLRSTEPPFLQADVLCKGPNTLYICATGRQQQLFAPLVVAVLGEVREAAYRRAAETGGVAPVLLAIDEAANIAPIPDLPAMVSEGGGQGLVALVCFQDLSQARARWGPHADGFVSLFGSTVVLPGIADVPTLRMLSVLAGEEEVQTRSIGSGPAGLGLARTSSQVSTTFQARLSLDRIARGRRGSALAVDAGNRFGWLTLTPAHATAPWRDLLGVGRETAAGDPGSRRSAREPSLEPTPASPGGRELTR